MTKFCFWVRRGVCRITGHRSVVTLVTIERATDEIIRIKRCLFCGRRTA